MIPTERIRSTHIEEKPLDSMKSGFVYNMLFLFIYER